MLAVAKNIFLNAKAFSCIMAISVDLLVTSAMSYFPRVNACSLM